MIYSPKFRKVIRMFGKKQQLQIALLLLSGLTLSCNRSPKQIELSSFIASSQLCEWKIRPKPGQNFAQVLVCDNAGKIVERSNIFRIGEARIRSIEIVLRLQKTGPSVVGTLNAGITSTEFDLRTEFAESDWSFVNQPIESELGFLLASDSNTVRFGPKPFPTDRCKTIAFTFSVE